MKSDFKSDFPLLLQKEQGGLPIAYLDNAVTTQKPRCVIEAVRTYWEHDNANPHRGSYSISDRATLAVEEVRAHVARFIGAQGSDEIIFTFGATDSLNQVANGFKEGFLKSGDEILISVAEHHSNLLPWQRLAKRTGSKLIYLGVDHQGRVSEEELRSKITPRTRILAITHASNVLGGVNPIKELTAIAHETGIIVVVDAAQSVAHRRIDLQNLDVDFLAFSGHKMLAPTGIGVLYGKKQLLKQMEPSRLGGGIVEEVTLQSVRFLDLPTQFEAGTQNTEGIIGLGAAIKYLETVGFDRIQAIEEQLMEYLGISSACRMSLLFYNTEEDIIRLKEALLTVREVLGLEP